MSIMFRKRSFLALLLALIFALIPAVEAQTLSGTVVRALNLRTAPNTRAQLITTMPAGTVVTLDGRNAANTWVRGSTQSGQVGWMFLRHVVVNGDINALPVTDGAVAAPAAPSNPAPTGGGGTVATANNTLNLRSGPGTNFAVIGRINVRGSFTVDGRDATGTWVRGINAAGQQGWAAASFLRGLNIGALPVVSGTVAAPSAPAPSAPAPVTNTASFSGFSYGGHVVGLSDQTVNAMRRARMTWVKKQIRHSQGADPNGVAGIINDAKSKGFRILLGVVGDKNQLYNGGYFEDYANYVAGLARLGADAIEVWNEPNIDHEWPSGQINPGSYTQLLAISYNAIKSANPGTMVVSAAPAPTGFFGGCGAGGCDDLPYIQGMAAAGAANYMDCIGVHYNEGILPPSQQSGDPRGNDHYTRYYIPMINTYSNAFGGRKPLCFTELGYVSAEGYPPLPAGFAWASNVTVGQQAAWLRDAINIGASSGRVRLIIIWNVDFTNYGNDPQAGFAIIRPGGGCPACDALAN
jgi:uncharacterized protein YraI